MKQAESRRGIALIIVLGMLAVLTVLGVAFMVTMRTERVAAGNFTEVMKARHLVYAALARAMQDIEKDLAWSQAQGATTTASYPSQWSTNYHPQKINVDFYTGDARALVPRGVLFLRGKLPSPGYVSEASGSVGGGMVLMDANADWENNVLNYGTGYTWVERIVPDNTDPDGIDEVRQRYWTLFANGRNTIQIQNDTDSDVFQPGHLYRIARPQWQPVEDVGRIAYLVIDASGLLDINMAGGAGTRGIGADPAELELGDLDDLGTWASSFLSERDGQSEWYENVADLDAQNNALSTPTVRALQNLFTYSHYPAAYTNIAPADLSGNWTDLPASAKEDRLKPIRESFREIVKPYYPNETDLDPAVEALVVNLHDYVDDDSVPGSYLAPGGNTQGPYVEAVPMISEVVITNTLTASGSMVSPFPQSRILIYVEYAYPFAGPPQGAPFTLSYTVEYVPDAQTPAGMFPAGPMSGAKTGINPSPNDQYVALTPFQPVVLNTATNTTNFTFDVVINAQIKNDAGQVVDQMATLTEKVAVTALRPDNPFNKEYGKDVIDPVYNWHPNHWRDSPPVFTWTNTLGTINSDTTNFFTRSDNSMRIDTNLAWSVRNGPMESVGELGYLYFPGLRYADPNRYDLYHSPNPIFNGRMRMKLSPWLWRTIRLYDRGDGSQWDRVLDYFAITDETTRRGLVNVNSQDLEPLGAVFNEMRIDDYPGGAVASTLEWSDAVLPDALDVAGVISGYTVTNQLDSLSDLGRSQLIRQLFQVLNLQNASEVRKEAVIRNACGLLHTRQNLFIILLAGKTEIAVEQRAMAVVWRDPTVQNGMHQSFIRWFTWLEK